MKRFKYGFYVLIILGVIYAANRIDEQHFKTAQHSLNSIYKDRVVAQNIIHQLSSILHEKEISYLTDSSKINNQSSELEELLEKYHGTILTSSERRELQSLEKHITELNTLMGQEKFSNKTKELFHEINKNLDQLSSIQLSESKNIRAIGQKSLDNNNLMSITEIILIVLVAIALLVLIFYKGS